MKDFVAITRRPSGQKKTLGASLGAPSGRANDFFAVLGAPSGRFL